MTFRLAPLVEQLPIIDKDGEIIRLRPKYAQRKWLDAADRQRCAAERDPGQRSQKCRCDQYRAKTELISQYPAERRTTDRGDAHRRDEQRQATCALPGATEDDQLTLTRDGRRRIATSA